MTIDEKIIDEMLCQIALTSKIKAIEFTHKVYGYSLKDSKAYVELLMEGEQ